MAPPAVDQGARAALEALAADGVLLAVVSNTMRTPGEVVRQILDQAGLLPLFRVLTFSDECGIRKPARAIFLRTLEELGVPAEHAVHVGDDAILDVEGARDAGMRGDPGDRRRAGHRAGEAARRHPAPRRAAGRAAPAPLMAFRLTGPRARVYLIATRGHRRGARAVPVGARLPAGGGGPAL